MGKIHFPSREWDENERGLIGILKTHTFTPVYYYAGEGYYGLFFIENTPTNTINAYNHDLRRLKKEPKVTVYKEFGSVVTKSLAYLNCALREICANIVDIKNHATKYGIIGGSERKLTRNDKVLFTCDEEIPLKPHVLGIDLSTAEGIVRKLRYLKR